MIYIYHTTAAAVEQAINRGAFVDALPSAGLCAVYYRGGNPVYLCDYKRTGGWLQPWQLPRYPIPRPRNWRHNHVKICRKPPAK